MPYVIEIPDYHPPAVNLLLGDWRKRHRLKQELNEFIRVYGLMADVPMARTHQTKRRVTLTIVLEPGQRACDPDAYWKATLDALVIAGYLAGDTHKQVELAPVQYERADRKLTRITLEECI